MSERAAPFYCPYCGEEDLRPFGEEPRQWRCGACRRVFALRYVGAARGWQSEPGADDSSDDNGDIAGTATPRADATSGQEQEGRR